MIRSNGAKPLAELSLVGLRIIRDESPRPRAVLMLSTPSGRIREVELDRVQLVHLIAEAAAANLTLESEATP